MNYFSLIQFSLRELVVLLQAKSWRSINSPKNLTTNQYFYYLARLFDEYLSHRMAVKASLVHFGSNRDRWCDLTLT